MIACSVDPALAHLLLGGPLFVALLAVPQPLEDDRLDEISSVVAAGLIAHTVEPRQPSGAAVGRTTER